MFTNCLWSCYRDPDVGEESLGPTEQLFQSLAVAWAQALQPYSPDLWEGATVRPSCPALTVHL